METEITFRSEQRLTQEEFFRWLQERPDDTRHYELIHGRIVMTPPANFRHGALGAWLVYKLMLHVEPRGLGLVLDASAGYDLPSGDTLEPDVSFISKERLAAEPQPEPGRFARIVPDLVIETASRSTARRDRTVKKEIYAVNGVREYWLVDPRSRTLTIFQEQGAAFDDGRSLKSGSVASAVFPSLELTVEEVFRDV